MGGGVDPAGRPEPIEMALSAEDVAGGPQASASHRVASQDAGQWLGATCPYLRSADGTWRSVVPQRGQRCWGQAPPAPLEPQTQERLCSTTAHTGCEIFLAAGQRHRDSLTRDHVAPERLDGRFGVMVRPSTLVLEESVRRVQVPVAVSAGRRPRVALALALAGGVVLVAFMAGLGGSAPLASPTSPPVAFVSPTPAASSTPVETPTPQPSESVPAPTQPVATPVVTPPPATQEPTPGPSPRIRTTYRVKKGDTLDGIAAHFGVTRKQIRAVNDFGNPPHLRYGMLLNIPYP